MSDPTHSDVYAQFLKLRRPYRLAGSRWTGVEVDPTAYRGPADREQAVAKLARKFPAKLLVSAGVARHAESTDEKKKTGTPLVPAPRLPDSKGALVALSRGPDEGPFEPLVETGGLSRRLPPVLAVCQDRWTRSCFREHFGGTQRLFVAFSLADVIALRSLGCPATLAAGLRHLGPETLEAVGRKFGWRPKNTKGSQGRIQDILPPRHVPGEFRVEPPETEQDLFDEVLSVNLTLLAGIDRLTALARQVERSRQQ